RGASDHAVYGQSPVSKPPSLEALEILALRRLAVWEGSSRNLAARELPSQRVARHQPLRCISQRMAGAVNAAVIGRDQAIAICETSGHSKAGCARRCCKPRGDQFAAWEV